MKDNDLWVQKLCPVISAGNNLAFSKVVLIDNLNGDMYGFTGLLKLNSHLVDTIDYTLATLYTNQMRQRTTLN